MPPVAHFKSLKTKKSSPISRSGRFGSGPASEVGQFTESVSFDWRLWRQDILGSIAHAAGLRAIGLLSKSVHRAIVKGLEAVGQEISEGKFRWQPALEDVHM